MIPMKGTSYKLKSYPWYVECKQDLPEEIKMLQNEDIVKRSVCNRETWFVFNIGGGFRFFVKGRRSFFLRATDDWFNKYFTLISKLSLDSTIWENVNRELKKGSDITLKYDA